MSYGEIRASISNEEIVQRIAHVTGWSPPAGVQTSVLGGLFEDDVAMTRPAHMSGILLEVDHEATDRVIPAPAPNANAKCKCGLAPVPENATVAASSTVLPP